MASRAFVSRFSPNRTDPAVLEAIFVQRHQLAERWLDRLRDSVLTGTKHHLLAIGPRGCGKSHLVALLVGRLRKDPVVAQRVRIAWLPEDETTPSFWKFLLRILRALNAEYGDEFPPLQRDQLAATEDDRRSALLTEYLLTKLDGRTLLVVVENLDDVMRGLKDEGQKRWRAFLQERAAAATLATAQQLTEDMSGRDRPFFNFFQIEHLQPLTADEALSLLQKIAAHSGNSSLATFLQSPTGRARVRAIRHLAGGSHRVFIILSEFATRENLDDLVTAFEELLDELTPYYQERLKWLPDQQREIVEFLCRLARTAPVKEIAAELFQTEQTAAAQLKSLKDKGYVTAGTIGRESRYELAEPLMRLCVEVKDPQREPIRLIVEFLRVWYDRTGVEARLQCLSDDANLERMYFSAVLQAECPGIPGPVEQILTRDLEAAETLGDSDEVYRILVELAEICDSAQRCLKVARKLVSFGRQPEALIACDRATALDVKNAVAWHNKGALSINLGRHAEAVNACNRAIELDPNYASAWANKGAALNRLSRHTEALNCHERAIKLNHTYAIAWSNKGFSLNELGSYELALTAIEKAINLDGKSAFAWNTKGCILNRVGRPAEALSAFERAIECDKTFAPAWYNIGTLLNQIGQAFDAMDAFDRAIDLNPKYSIAWNMKGHVLNKLGKTAQALYACEQAIAIDPKFVVAWSNLGWTLYELGRYTDSVDACNRAIELDPKYAFAWKNRGRANLRLGNFEEGMRAFRHGIESNVNYAAAYDCLAEAYVNLGNWDDAERVVTERFRLPICSDNPVIALHLPDLIATVFRASNDRTMWNHRVGRLAEIAGNAFEDLQKENRDVQTNHINLVADTNGAPALVKPVFMLGDSLVRSLTKKSYAEATAEALDAWADVWREVAERHRELSLATRLFGVGVRYVQTKDERVLLDLVQEERSILRNLFRLDDNANPD